MSPYDNEGPCVTAPRVDDREDIPTSGIGVSVSRLFAALEETQKVVALLAKGLAPVMLPDVPREAPAMSETQDRASVAPLGGEISNATERIVGMRRQLLDLHNRLDL